MHFIPCKESEVECDKKKKEVSAIRKLSNLAAEGAKAAAGTAAKSLGGLGVSFGGFVKLSVGDNDSVKQIVETVASVTAKRKTEYLLYSLQEKESSCPKDSSCQNKLAKLIENFDEDLLVRSNKSSKESGTESKESIQN